MSDTPPLRIVASVQPVGINKSYKPVRLGRRHAFAKTDEAKAYQEALRFAALGALRGHPAQRRPLFDKKTRCEVRITFVHANERHDVDSPLKPTLDALEGYAYDNDRQVRRLVVEKGADKEQPRVEVEVLTHQRTVQLGSMVRDRISGFVGIVTCRVQYLLGGNQCLVAPLVNGAAIESRWCDEHQIEVV